jgi:hypothetical protein
MRGHRCHSRRFSAAIGVDRAEYFPGGERYRGRGDARAEDGPPLSGIRFHTGFDSTASAGRHSDPRHQGEYP